jgi:hypothetical protein
MAKQKKQKAKKQQALEERMIDHLLANGFERGWISDEVLQKCMAAERNKATKQNNRHLIAGDYN